MAGLLELNTALDLPALRSQFAAKGRLQVRNFLRIESANALRSVIAEETPWSLAWQEGASERPQVIKPKELAALTAQELRTIASRASADPDYGFAYYAYPLVTAYVERWNPGAPQEQLLEELNGASLLEFMRSLTGYRQIAKMDGQATLYGPGHFLRPHNDEESRRGRLVAYVLNLTHGEWRPEWGGSLNFLDRDWNVTEAFGPLFNCLNVFRVPQWHEVSQVADTAPLARYAITGWARDR
jgi:SM-20-related protein